MEIITSLVSFLTTNLISIIVSLVKGGVVLFVGWKGAK